MIVVADSGPLHYLILLEPMKPPAVRKRGVDACA